MKAKIDEEECTACEDCVDTLPSIFQMNDDGDMAVVKETPVPSDLEDEVKEVAEDCPAEAIIIED
jgi:ferredoxin